MPPSGAGLLLPGGGGGADCARRLPVVDKKAMSKRILKSFMAFVFLVAEIVYLR
jgi:hypothetical protein